eukprot:gnl/Hemi2/19637_TR6519_c0_g1_i1.p1 gnl/Hemi2/19637_TR6519_c0_g1~~gnl/Hemi2/19637_TR6519_c0_g1_i1.p1  ORF type:complete len:496 (+),score=106.63 gnl/Hemi2/19637_TR6519_c0_g1_i1:97-1584(+)
MDGAQLARHAAVLLELCGVGCCQRCALRFAGIRDISLYTAANEELSQLFDKLPRDPNAAPSNASGIADQPCTACVGCLQLPAAAICDAIRASNHQFRDFTLTVSLPISTITRHHAVWFHLVAIFSELAPLNQALHVVELKDAVKWVYGETLSTTLGTPFSVHSPFKINLAFTHEETLQEPMFLCSIDELPDIKARRKPRPRWKPGHHGARAPRSESPPMVSAATVLTAMGSMTPALFRKHANVPPARVSTGASFSVRCVHDPIFVAGRYLKFCRYLSQSPWVIDGVKKTADSVEELINVHLDLFKADEMRLASAGREDVDVRMLGTGRPFIFEMVNPHVVPLEQSVYQAIEQRINAGTKLIEVNNLRLVGKEFTQLLKQGQEHKKKTYRCVVWLSCSFTADHAAVVNSIKDLQLSQKTPVRVLHRRSLCTRVKVIHSAACTPLNDHFIVLDLVTSAGTYIKEFVHGDLGRTTPNLGSLLGCDADILQLDVVNIDM